MLPPGRPKVLRKHLLLIWDAQGCASSSSSQQCSSGSGGMATSEQL